LGLGLYFPPLFFAFPSPACSTPTFLPLWLAQLLSLFSFCFFSLQAQLPFLPLLFTVCMTSSFFVPVSISQLAQRHRMPCLFYPSPIP
ncbi:hypothetical protein OFM89_18970, partial [Acinetobacter baumannii]|nr:hypothetical protein [Acinetobacter baumannii]